MFGPGVSTIPNATTAIPAIAPAPITITPASPAPAADRRVVPILDGRPVRVPAGRRLPDPPPWVRP